MAIIRNDSTQTNFSIRREAIWAQLLSCEDNTVTGSIYPVSGNPQDLTANWEDLNAMDIANAVGTPPATDINMVTFMRYKQDKTATSGFYMQYIPYFDWYLFNDSGLTASSLDGSINMQFQNRTATIPLLDDDPAWLSEISAGFGGMLSAATVTSSGATTVKEKSLTRRAYNDNTSDADYRWPTRDQSGSSFVDLNSDGMLNGISANVSYTQTLNYNNSNDAGTRWYPTSVTAIEQIYYFQVKTGAQTYRAFGWNTKRFDKDGWDNQAAVIAIKVVAGYYRPKTSSGNQLETPQFEPKSWDTGDADAERLADQFDPETGAWTFPENTTTNYQPSGSTHEDTLAHHFCIGVKTTITGVTWGSFSSDINGDPAVGQHNYIWTIYMDGESLP